MNKKVTQRGLLRVVSYETEDDNEAGYPIGTKVRCYDIDGSFTATICSEVYRMGINKEYPAQMIDLGDMKIGWLLKTMEKED